MLRAIVLGIVLATVLSDVAFAQSPTDPTPSRRRFGAPVVQITTLRGQGAVMFGGRGGWAVSPTLLLGFGAYGTISEVDARDGAVPLAPGALDIKFESFGVELEYAARAHAPTHVTLGALVGGGAAHNVRDGTSEQHGETDFMLLVEPSVGVQQRVTEAIHLHAALSYRYVHGVEQIGLKPADLRGAALAIGVRIGRF